MRYVPFPFSLPSLCRGDAHSFPFVGEFEFFTIGFQSGAGAWWGKTREEFEFGAAYKAG